MWNPFRRKEGQVKIYSSLLSTAGLDTDVQLCPRTLRRARQQNMEIKPKTVLSYYAVFSCISLIASDIAKMPPRLMKQDTNGVRRKLKPER